MKIKIVPEWEHVLRDMKSKMPVEKVLYRIGHDRSFFRANGLNYTNPCFRELKKYIEKL